MTTILLCIGKQTCNVETIKQLKQTHKNLYKEILSSAEKEDIMKEVDHLSTISYQRVLFKEGQKGKHNISSH